MPRGVHLHRGVTAPAVIGRGCRATSADETTSPTGRWRGARLPDVTPPGRIPVEAPDGSRGSSRACGRAARRGEGVRGVGVVRGDGERHADHLAVASTRAPPESPWARAAANTKTSRGWCRACRRGPVPPPAPRWRSGRADRQSGLAPSGWPNTAPVVPVAGDPRVAGPRRGTAPREGQVPVGVEHDDRRGQDRARRGKSTQVCAGGSPATTWALVTIRSGADREAAALVDVAHRPGPPP